MTDTTHPTLTARTPEDILALVPIVLGFTPDRSLVMVPGRSRGRPPHARVDLPTQQRDIAPVVRMLLEPACRHGAKEVAFVLYGPDSPLLRSLVRRLAKDTAQRQIDILEVLRVEDGQWSVWQGRRWSEPEPFDAAVHPFRAEAVLRGLVVRDSREELAESLQPDDALVALVGAELAGDAPNHQPASQDLVREAVWVYEVVTMFHREDPPLPPSELARLLRAVRVGEVRDAAWVSMTRDHAPDQVALWTSVLRAAPEGWAAAPAALLGLAAWLAGHGALAWCALDRCRAEDPQHSLGSLVSCMVENAVSPDLWEAYLSAEGSVLDQPEEDEWEESEEPW